MIAKIGRIVTSILIAIFFLCLAVLVVPRLFGGQWITIESGSMEPALPVGSACLVTPSDDIERDDIITFYPNAEDPDVIVTHRVVSLNGEGEYITKGDANNVTDAGMVLSEQIIGKVRFCVPGIAVLLFFVSSVRGKIVLCAALIMLICLNGLLSGEGDHKKEKTDVSEDVSDVQS